MKRIIILLLLVLVSVISFGQNIKYIRTNDSTLTIMNQEVPADTLWKFSKDGYLLKYQNNIIIDTFALKSQIGSGGTTDHSLLINRDIADQHTINSITNLSDTLSDVYDSLLNGNLHSASESQIPYFDGTIWQTTTDVSAINVSLLYYNMWSNTWNATTDPTADGQILTYRVNGGENDLAFEWESPATTFSEITATSATFDTIKTVNGQGIIYDNSDGVFIENPITNDYISMGSDLPGTVFYTPNNFAFQTQSSLYYLKNDTIFADGTGGSTENTLKITEITAASATIDTVYFADGTYFVTNVLTYDGIRNTGLGLFVFEDLTSGASNTAFGWSSLTNNTEGSNNVAYGDQSLYGNTLGTNNVAIGSSSLGANSSGDYNVAVGNNSLSSNSTGTNNIAIGYKAGNNSTNYSNKLYINSLNRLGLDADSTQSIIYGQQHTDVTKQELYLNANTYTKNLTVEDTITSDVQILNGTTITDVVTMKEAMEGTLIDSLSTNDSLKIKGKLTSTYYIGESYTDDGSVTVSTTPIDSYRTITGMTPYINENTTVNDSSIIVSSNGSGYYTVYGGFSYTHSVNSTICHASLFINDVEYSVNEAQRKIGTGGDYGDAGRSCVVWLNAGDVVKFKAIGDNTGTLTINHGTIYIKR